ncbi:MmpS family transport accessory protein [Streptosporangium amethystogenes]|uniref:MmpS family transport accessory protein n=1 Tax=Streptosporangium amethystogenes TaxID=2002 RepID=UPI0037879B4A
MANPYGPHDPYQQGYDRHYGYAPPQPPVRTNGLAVASLVLGLAGFITCGITSLLAVIFGHVALGQIRRDRTDGHGMALTGVILGWILTGLWILYWMLVLAGVVAGFADLGSTEVPREERTHLTASQPPATEEDQSADAHTVVFEATGADGATSAGNITYTVKYDIKQDQGVSLPYSKKVSVNGELSLLYLWVQNAGDTGSVTCRIKVDGKVVREATATEPYGVCTVKADAP